MNRPESPCHDESLLHSVIEASPAGMLIVNSKGKIVLANRAALEQFGYCESELINQSIELLIPESYRHAHLAHRGAYLQRPRSRSMAAGRNLFARRKDGKELAVDISLHPIEVQHQQMVLANVVDATDRRRMEQEREQRQAIERLALMGQLAGAVAHEIRTPLCVIRNDAYFLKLMADKLGEEGMECIEEINKAVSKAERIVSDLLDFTRNPKSDPKEVEMDELIDDAIRAAGVPASLELIRHRKHETSRVHVDVEQIERLLINLIQNAAYAAGEGGHVEIDTCVCGETLRLEVSDSGPGIAPENLERVFEPLFTTKPKGIGLGLSVSRQYAERNDGTLTVQNVEGSGARFCLTLPLSKSAT